MKIGIVNDMPLAVEAMRRVLALEPRHEVIWIAHSGNEALQRLAERKPELVLMDLIMPGMDGVETTRRIMARHPCPILVVTVSVGTNTRRVYEAMGCGALDAVDTPPLGRGDLASQAAPLLNKIATIQRLTGGDGIPRSPALARRIRPDAGGSQLVAIGASAGGPAALLRVLSDLPEAFSVPIVIVQHVDVQFAEGMAEWLSQGVGRLVRLVHEGDRPQRGDILLAGTSDHLVFTDAERLGYTPNPRDYPYRPSADTFFESVVQHWAGPVVGVVLTGMGRDGAIGLKALRNAGHYTIAQDQETSAVYGMPKAAAALGAAVDVLPLGGIAAMLVHQAMRS
jgi:two-component system response regulator WspF